MKRDRESAGNPIVARLRAATLVVVGVVLAGAVVEVALGQQQWFWEHPAATIPSASPTSTRAEPSGMPALINDPSQPDWMVQGEWYCWNTGPDFPHHLGYHVPNDHLCTWGELRSDGFAYMP